MIAFITGLEKLIQQEALIAREPSLEGVSKDLDLPTTLYFGIGLCNRNSVSKGLPVDVLSMILLSELVGQNKNILIADTHANFNGFDKKEIEKVAKQYQETILRVLSNLRFGSRSVLTSHMDNWNVLLASSIDGTTEYREIVNSIHEENEYVRRELADIEWFKQKRAKLKVGWALNGESGETFFDKKFTGLFRGMSFLYLEAGRTFDPKKPKSAPYFCENPAARIMLESSEDAEAKFKEARQKFGEQGTRTYANYLKRLVALYDKVVERTERGPIEHRIQQIVERCLR